MKHRMISEADFRGLTSLRVTLSLFLGACQADTGQAASTNDTYQQKSGLHGLKDELFVRYSGLVDEVSANIAKEISCLSKRNLGVDALVVQKLSAMKDILWATKTTAGTVQAGTPPLNIFTRLMDEAKELRLMASGSMTATYQGCVDDIDLATETAGVVCLFLSLTEEGASCNQLLNQTQLPGWVQLLRDRINDTHFHHQPAPPVTLPVFQCEQGKPYATWP